MSGITIDYAFSQAVGAATVVAGNDSTGAEIAEEFRAVVYEAAKRAPRSQQLHLGPSELGVACDRQVVGKLTRTPAKNTTGDSWPSTVGTAVHSWLEEALQKANAREGWERYLTELRVTPFEGHEGTTDGYDRKLKLGFDHKVLGVSSLSKIRRQGPSRKYRAQLGLYALGLENAGYEVEAVALIAYPRTEATLDSLYVWHAPFDADYRALVEEVREDTKRRKTMAELVELGAMTLGQVPPTPDDECNFCPLYRPNAIPTQDGSFAGCRGAHS